MFSRKNAYESTEQSKGLDDMSKKLAVDLRKHIKKLEMVPAYSKEWIAMTDTLLHISNIALMENRLPQDNKADSTLWEGDELTVRFMLEEGKLNLALRLMHEYKKAQAAELSKGEGSYAEFLASTAAAVELADAEQLKARLLVFEQSLGTLLRCSLEHVEAVQTTDLPELMQYAAEVLGRAAAADAAGHEWDRTQEVMLLRYLSSVMARVETLGEQPPVKSAVCPAWRHRRIRPPGGSKGPGCSSAPQSAAGASGRLAAASEARRGPGRG